jgi:hypothetical protein
MNGPLRFFERIPAFSIFDRDELMQLALNASSRLYSAGAYIMKQGKLVDDEDYFGLLKIGKCNVMQIVDSHGNALAPALFTSPVNHLISNQAQDQEQEQCQGKPNGTGSSTCRDASAKEHKQSIWHTHYYRSKLPGDILFHRALIGEHSVGHHTLSVVADTCVEVIFLPRNALSFALRRSNKLKSLMAGLHEYPTKSRLKHLVAEDRLWKHFQARVVKQFLSSTLKGRHMLERIRDLERLREQAQTKRIQAAPAVTATESTKAIAASSAFPALSNSTQNPRR